MAMQTIIRSINDCLDAEVLLEWRREIGEDTAEQLARLKHAKQQLQQEITNAQPCAEPLVGAAQSYLSAQISDRLTAADQSDPTVFRRVRRELVQHLRGALHGRDADRSREEASVHSPYPHRILVAIDDSEPSEWAVEIAGRLAQTHSARVLVVNVTEPDEREFAFTLDEDARWRSGSLLEKAQAAFPAGVESEQMQREGVASDEIISAARIWEADLVVMGTRGRGRLAQFVLGSTAEAVIRHAVCPVLAVGHEPSPWLGRASDASRANVPARS